MPTKKKEASGFGVSVIFILSVVVLILMFVLFTRDQSAKTVESTLTNLAQTNAELQKAQQAEKTKSVADRLKEAGVDPETVWTLGECKEPYCQFTKLSSKEGSATAIRSIERWEGRHDTYDDGKVSCDMFVLGDKTSLPINLELLAKVEQNLLKASTNQETVEVTVYRSEDKERDLKTGNPCESPAYVLNVHFE